MNLKELKESLRRCASSDLDDCLVLLHHVNKNGEKDYSLLVFTGYFEIEGKTCIVLGDT